MDIEEIRKRHADYKFRSNNFDMSEKEHLSELCMADADRDDLLDYISTLESENQVLKEKLRWKKVAEEKPLFGKVVLLRDPESLLDDRCVGWLVEPDGIFRDNLMWRINSSSGLVHLNRYPEWREI